MFTPIKSACAVLLALPIAAMAAPVSIVTHTTGTVKVDDDVMQGLGVDNPQNATTLPYDLTLTSNVDWAGALPAYGQEINIHDATVGVDLLIAGHTYHYAGAGEIGAKLSSAGTGVDRYEYNVFVPLGWVSGFNFFETFTGPAGSFGAGGALTPGHAQGGAADGQGLGINYQFQRYWDELNTSVTSGTVASYSVDVTSPVPEPSAFAMLGLGVVALGVRRRIKRTQA